MSTRRHGYVLLETIVALAVLSIGVVAVNRSLFQIMLTQAIARDTTQARFLLETLMAGVELEPVVTPGATQGDFGDEYPGFGWRRVIDAVQVAPPTLPADVAAPPPVPTRPMGRIEIAVSWSRRGQRFEESLVTLVRPDRLRLIESEADENEE